MLFVVVYMYVVDDLLVKSRVCATTLPKINPRLFLEDGDRLEPRVSGLGEELDELDGDEGDAEVNGRGEHPVNGNGHVDSDGDQESPEEQSDEDMEDG